MARTKADAMKRRRLTAAAAEASKADEVKLDETKIDAPKAEAPKAAKADPDRQVMLYLHVRWQDPVPQVKRLSSSLPGVEIESVPREKRPSAAPAKVVQEGC